MKRLILAILLCLAINTAPAAANYAPNITPGGLLQGNNQERTAAGVGNLTVNLRLTSAAQARANDMAARDYWSHRSPEGWDSEHFIDNAGYKGVVIGENLAYGQESNSEIIAHWMSSPTHRTVMLDGRFKEVGYATADSADYQGTGPQTIVVAMYGAPVNKPRVVPTPQPETPQAVPAEPTQPAKPLPADVPGEMITTSDRAERQFLPWWILLVLAIIVVVGAVMLVSKIRKFGSKKLRK